MAMSGTGLGNVLYTKLTAAFLTYFKNLPDDHELPGYDEDSIRHIECQAIGEAIVEYFQSSATVTGNAGGYSITDGRVE